MKHRLRKARNLIKRHYDSWGSLEKHFNQRLVNRREAAKARREARQGGEE